MYASAISTVGQPVRETSRGASRRDGTAAEPSDQEFAALLRGVLGNESANSINEEELFAGLIEYRLAAHAGAEVAAAYHERFLECKTANTRPDGVVYFEKAAAEALAALEADGTLSADLAATVRTEAFRAAQLDDNHHALYDGFGSEEDPTIALMEFEAAMFAARATLQQIESGQITTDDATGAAADGATTGGLAASGNVSDGAKAGFTFKPVSENNGNLVVLLPAPLAGRVKSAVLKDASGATLESGRSTGMANPDQVGEREHFRFSKPGGRYPANLVVEVALNDGTSIAYRIPNPSQRYD